MYSQNKEDDKILDFFGKLNPSYKGNVLDIGANDGITYSNSLAFIRKGWGATLIEPSKKVWEKAVKLHQTNMNVVVLNVAIGEMEDEKDFFDSGTLLGTGDEGLVSTLHLKETARWGGRVKYNTVKTKVLPLSQALGASKHKEYAFASIDCEGEDLNILKQCDFTAMKTLVVCVEYNSIDQPLYDAVMLPQGFNPLFQNGENLVYARYQI